MTKPLCLIFLFLIWGMTSHAFSQEVFECSGDLSIYGIGEDGKKVVKLDKKELNIPRSRYKIIRVGHASPHRAITILPWDGIHRNKGSKLSNQAFQFESDGERWFKVTDRKTKTNSVQCRLTGSL